MIERRIKELSFALEALSRIGNSYDVLNSADAVNTLLKKAIDEANGVFETPPKRSSDLDDEIPF